MERSVTLDCVLSALRTLAGRYEAVTKALPDTVQGFVLQLALLREDALGLPHSVAGRIPADLADVERLAIMNGLEPAMIKLRQVLDTEATVTVRVRPRKQKAIA